MAWKLTELFVELTARGLDKIQSSLGSMQSIVTSVSSTVQNSATSMSASFAGIGGNLDRTFGSGGVVERDTGITRTLLGTVQYAITAVGKAAQATGQTVAAAFKEINAAIAGVKSPQAAPAFNFGDLSKQLANFQATGRVAMPSFGFGELNAQIDALVKSAPGKLDTLKTSVDKIQKSIAGLASAGTIGFAMLSASVGGFVRAGLSGTAIGDQLSFQMGQLSRAIAGIFRPEIEKLVDTIRSIVGWFHNLSGEQRESIANWTKGAAAALFAASVFPKVAAGLQLVATAGKALWAVLTGGLSEIGFDLLVPLLGAVTAAIAGLIAGTESGRNAFGEFAEAIKPIGKAVVDIVGALGSVLKPIVDIVGNILKAVAAILTPIFQVIGGIAKIVGGMLQIALQLSGIGMLIKMLALLAEILAKAFEPVIKVFDLIGDMIGEVSSLIDDTFGKLGELIVDLFKPGMDFIKKFVADVLRSVAEMLTTIHKAIIAVRELFGIKHKEKPKDERGPMAKNVGGFTSVQSLYEKAAEQSVKLGGKSIEEKQLDVAEQQLGEQKKTNDRLNNLQPAVQR